MNNKNKKYLDEYIAYLRNERRYSENTIISYVNDVTMLIDFIEENEFGDLDDISKKVPTYYVAYLTDKNFSNKSIQRKISGIKTMYKYFVEDTKKMDFNPFFNVTVPKVEKTLPKYAFENEIDEFLNAIDKSTDTGKRDYFIFTLLYGSGLRVSELCGLVIGDIDPDSRRIIVHGKGSKDRIVPMSKRSREAFLDYMVLSRPVLLSRSKNLDNNTLLLNFHGGSLTDRGVRDILSRLLTETCSTLNVSPHTFRHSFATHLLNSGMDVRMVQELLGHSNLSTTQIYTKLSRETLIETYNKTFPKGKDND